MSLVTIIIFILIVAIIAWLGFLSYKASSFINEKKAFYDKISKVDIEDHLISQGKQLKKLSIDRDELYNTSDEISKKISQSLTKCGLVRFNPFAGEGGKQSFSAAFLDDNDSGIIISSLYSRSTGSRIFAKPIKRGTSEIKLTEEEKKAIRKSS